MRHLSAACHEIIRYLNSHGPTAADDLAEGIARSPLGTRQALNRLKAKGFVVSKQEEQNGPGRRALLWSIVLPTKAANDVMDEKQVG